MNRPEEGFRAAIERAGLAPPTEIIGDGQLHRFASNGERGDDAGWYVLHANGGIPAGAFGCWRVGIEETWRADVGRELTTEEERAHRERAAAARKAREDEERRQHADAKKRAEQIWEHALQASIIHPYLRAKGIQPHNARSLRGDLVLPVLADGKMHSLQFIGPDGLKKFLPRGRVAGGYCSLGWPDGRLVICEGFATGASIREATSLAVAVAFNAGNLTAVAKAMKARFPAVRLIVAADDDVKTPGNPGLTKATEAAREVGGLLAVPDFGDNRPEGASDFNDLARYRGADAVRACIEGAARIEPARRAQPGRSSSTPSPQFSRAPGAFPEAVQIIRADTIQPEPVDWLWRDYLAAGKLHILAGAPGTGKTTIALAIGAALSCAGRWPNGERVLAGSVLIWSGEDSHADTLVPRLLASGADCQRIHFVGKVDDAEGRRPFDPATDFPNLEREAAAIPNLRLVIVDPIVSAVAGDSHKNAEVRRGLQPLVDFADSTRCAVIGISHFSKGTSGRDPTERVTGSLAFGALARIVLATAKAGDDAPEGTRLLVRAKSNLGPDGGGFQYVLRTVELTGPHRGIAASRVEWGAALEGGARELLSAAEQEGDVDERSATEEAIDSLRGILVHGRVGTKEARRALKAEGFTEKQIRRARESLGVRRERDGFGGADYWRLPTTAPGSCPSSPVPAVHAPTSDLGNNGHELGQPVARVAVHAHTCPTTKQGHERQEREHEGMNGADAEVL